MRHCAFVDAGVTASTAWSALRDMLGQLRVDRASEYRTHDLRRGHAKDLQMSGVTFEGVFGGVVGVTLSR